METKEEKVKRLIDFAKEVNALNAEIRKLGIEGLELEDLEIPVVENDSADELQETKRPQTLEEIVTEINAVNARARELGLHGIVDIELDTKDTKEQEEPEESVQDTTKDQLRRQEMLDNIKKLHGHNFEMIESLWNMIKNNQQILDILAKSGRTQTIAEGYYPFAASQIGNIMEHGYSDLDYDSEKSALARGWLEEVDKMMEGVEVMIAISEDFFSHVNEIIDLSRREEEMRKEDFEAEMKSRFARILGR